MSDAPAVQVDDLRITYGDVVAVDGVSFRAHPGEVLALLGPNGAGKTSTIEALEGYRRPAAGTVRVLGHDPLADHAAVVGRIGVMLQEGGLYPGIRTAEVLDLFAAYYDDPADPAALLERVGLAPQAKATARHLSGGQQQRLALALALVGRPRVAFLDEPTAGLDVDGRLLVRDVVREQRDAGVCVMLATHDLAEAEKVADRVVIVDRGRVVADGTPAELMSATGAEIRFAAPAGLDVAALGQALGAPVSEATDGEYLVDAEPSPARSPPSPPGWPSRTWPWATSGPVASTWRTSSSASPGKRRRERRHRPAGPGPGRDHALAAARRVPAAHPRHPRRAAGVLLDRRRAAHRRRRPGRLPGSRGAGPRGDVHGHGQPGHRHGLRAPVPGAEAPRRHPLGRGRLLGAKTIAIGLVLAVQVVILSVVGLLLGWEPDVAGVPLALAGAVLATVAFAGLGLLMAGTLRGEMTLALANGLYLVLLLLGGMVIPLDELPAALQTVAELLPAAALADIMIGALTPGGEIATRSWVVLVVWAVAMPIAAVRWFRWE